MPEKDAALLDRGTPQDTTQDANEDQREPGSERTNLPPLDTAPLKVLFVSWYFPPFNTMGALRGGKLAKFLHERGHEVRVVSAAGVAAGQTLQMDFPEDQVVRTPHLDVNWLPKAVQGLRMRLKYGKNAVPQTHGRQAAAAPDGQTASTGGGAGLLSQILRLYQAVLNFPDPQVGWLRYAVSGGRRLTAGWKPDVVLATAPPFTALFVGRRLARMHRVPLVLEYRDRWTEDPYGDKSGLRLFIERTLEARLLRAAKAIVTVSEPWAEAYRKRVPLPVSVVANGFDEDDYPATFDRGQTDPDVLRIVYTGILYADKRDPSPLFAALAKMGEEADPVRVEFYGADPNLLKKLAERHGVQKSVTTHPRVPYQESVELQLQADVLLLMQWNNPREQGNVPGKLFEYIGARRPVLGLGLEDGVPATVLQERGAGEVINDPDKIAEKLRAWIAQKRELGYLPLIPIEARNGLTRQEQYLGLEKTLYETLERK